MQIHEIKRVHAHKKAKLVARGGKRGKTAGKGGKGQTARAGHHVRPAMRDIIKKLPKLRGHGKNRSESVFYRGPEAVVNVHALNVFGKGDTVNLTTLVEKGLIKAILGKVPTVKILGTGDVSVALTVTGCTVSASAQAKIEKAGGTITTTAKPKPQTEAQLKKIADRKAAKAEAKSGKKGGSKKKK